MAGLPRGDLPDDVAGRVLRRHLRVRALLGDFYITYSPAGTARTLPAFVLSGIAVGSSPIYTALATITSIPGLGLLFFAEFMRRRAVAKRRIEVHTE